MQGYKKFKITGMILGLILMMNTASAALLIEPHLGYNLGTSGDSASYSGGQFGMRLGYQQLGLMAGLDFTRSSFDMDVTTQGKTTKNDFERNEYGIFVGYDFPIFIRAWAAYYFGNKTKDSTANTESTGNTKELGVGLTALPFLSVNLMYRMVDLNEFKNSAGAKSDIETSNQEFVVGISMPITL